MAAGLGGAPQGYGVAGSVAINPIDTDTLAKILGGAVTGSSLSIIAEDTTSIVAVAGAIAFGGKAGIGAGVVESGAAGQQGTGHQQWQAEQS